MIAGKKPLSLMENATPRELVSREEEQYLNKLANRFEATLRERKDKCSQDYVILRTEEARLNDTESKLKSIAEVEAAVMATYADAERHGNRIVLNKTDDKKITDARNNFAQALRAVDRKLGDSVIGAYFGIIQQAALNTLGVTIAKTEKNRAR